MKLSNTIFNGEKNYLERNMVDMEVHKSTDDKHAEESKVWIAYFEAHNSSLEVLLKATNERKMDITPLREHALSLRNNIYQMQAKIVGDDYRIKKVEARLQEISVISIEFKARTQ